MKKTAIELDPIKRNNFDFEMLYLQQVEMQRLTGQHEIALVQMQSHYAEKPYSDSSCIFFAVTNPLRKVCINLCLNPYFDYCILLVILANCVTLVLADSDPNNGWSVTTDISFLVVFTVESALKIIAIGFLFGKNSYLKDPWNILDFTVVIVGWIGYIVGGQNISVIRTIRILRPLRTINSIPEMKILTLSILKSLPLLFDIFLLLFLFLLIFALVGTQLYGGLFSQQCINLDGTSTGNLCYLAPSCKEFELNCGNSGCDLNQYCWNTNLNPTQGITSFDNIPIGLLTVFTAITMEGWSDVMRMGRAVTNQKFLNDIYFYVLIVVGAFFMIKLTVAAIFVKFEKSSKEQKAQMALISEKKPKKIWKPTEPENRTWVRYKWYQFRLFCYNLIMKNWFGILTMVLIILNTVVMGSEYYGMTQIHEIINSNSNIALNVCFCIEMILKIFGLGLRGYVDESFNIFEGLIVLLGMTEIIFLSGSKSLQGLLVFRAFRLLRVFKLARSWKKLRMLLSKLLGAAKSISYLGLLSLIMVFIFTLLGKQLFQDILVDSDGSIPRMNFNTLFWSFVTVFDILTSENWNSIMYNAAGPNGIGYTLYFIFVLVVGNYVLLNLFLAILISQFENDDDDDDEATLPIEYLESQENFEGVPVESKEKRNKEKLRIRIDHKASQPLQLKGNSFYIFNPQNFVRTSFRLLMLHPYFDSAIYCLIALSCAILMLDEPNQIPITVNFLSIISNVVLALFTLEFLIKSIVLGFVQGKSTYLRNSWNCLDFFIVSISYLDILLVSFGGGVVKLSFLRAFRALRALRPLRMVSHNERMKKVVTSVIQAVPAVLNVMLITVLFYIIFGILGVIFFKGLMFYCTDLNIQMENECFGDFIDASGSITAREWRELSYNFDNIFNAILTLFDISTLEAWPSYLVGAVDGVSPQRAMIRDYNPAAALFYIVYIFIMNFFIMNLYLGTIIKKFNEIQQELDGSEFLSYEQKEWIRTQKMLFLVKPRTRFTHPDSKFRGFFYKIVMNYKFDYLIQSLIVLNVIFMSLYSFPLDPDLDNLLALANYVFIAIFTLEMILKMTGLGFRCYFSETWNRFDCLITLLSLFTLTGDFGISNATVLRALRIARLFRLIKILKGFQFIFNSLILSAPSLINVGTLLLLLWFVYGIAGMYLFGNLDLSVTQILDKDQNFNTFYNAINLLIQCITGENWDLIMRDCMGNYDCQGSYDKCGNPYIAVVYWLTYTILGQYFFLNMFIAVILENFNEEEENLTSAGITEKDLRKFQKAWSKFAPLAQHFIKVSHLPELMQNLDSPLGFKGQNLSSAQMLNIIHALQIKEYDGTIHFADLMWTLAAAISGSDLSKAPKCEAVQNILKALPRSIPMKKMGDSRDVIEKESYASRILAALVIWKVWKEFKANGPKRKGLQNMVWNKYK